MQQAKIMWITKHIFQCSSSLSLQQYPLPTQFPSISTILKHNYWLYYIIDSYWFKPLNKQKKHVQPPIFSMVKSLHINSFPSITSPSLWPGFRTLSRASGTFLDAFEGSYAWRPQGPQDRWVMLNPRSNMGKNGGTCCLLPGKMVKTILLWQFTGDQRIKLMFFRLVLGTM
jgi:hypothetical protein